MIQKKYRKKWRNLGSDEQELKRGRSENFAYLLLEEQTERRNAEDGCLLVWTLISHSCLHKTAGQKQQSIRQKWRSTQNTSYIVLYCKHSINGSVAQW